MYSRCAFASEGEKLWSLIDKRLLNQVLWVIVQFRHFVLRVDTRHIHLLETVEKWRNYMCSVCNHVWCHITKMSSKCPCIWKFPHWALAVQTFLFLWDVWLMKAQCLITKLWTNSVWEKIVVFLFMFYKQSCEYFSLDWVSEEMVFGIQRSSFCSAESQKKSVSLT